MTSNALLSGYKSFLEKKYSKVTIKNYLSDLNHFIEWSDNTFKNEFSIDSLDKRLISSYKKSFGEKDTATSSQLSYRTLKRHLSTLRSFTAYAVSEGYLASDPFEDEKNVQKPIDVWSLKEFKDYLYETGSSPLTIKYYTNDIQAFSRWIKEVFPSSVSSTKTLHPVSDELIREYANRLEFTLHLAPKSINRKLSSIRRYLQFLKTQQISAVETSVNNIAVINNEAVTMDELLVTATPKSYSSFPPLRLMQRMVNPYFDMEGKLADILSDKVMSGTLKKTFTPTKNLKNPKVFDQMLLNMKGKNISKEFFAPNSIALSTLPTHQKILFHLRHTRPQWYRRYHSYAFVHYMHFAILTILAVTASFVLYNNTLGKATAQQAVTDNLSGKTFVFRGKLLDKDGNPLTAPTDIRLSLYSSPTASGSALLWQETQSNLRTNENGEVSLVIGSRQPIPGSFFNTNTPLYLGVTIKDGKELTPRKPIGVPYADNAFTLQGLEPITNSSKQSNVLLALDASGALSIGGNANPVFQATGGDFTLSGETLVLVTNPSSNGNIIINPDGNGRIDVGKPLINSESGNIGIEGSLSLVQEGSGTFLTASSSGSNRFVIDNQGTITKGIWAGSPISPEFGGFGANITPASAGEILYSTNTTSYGHLRAGMAGDCLRSNGFAAPMWSSCGYLSQLNGVVAYTAGIDLLLGDISTGSAKFAFSNMTTGTPTFKVGNNLSLNSTGRIQTNNTDLILGGDTTKNIILTASNDNQRVGIGTNSPTRTLDLTGTFGGNVDFFTDGASTQTLTRDTRALVYDLEKNTGTQDDSYTTTYNITGLPNTDGTIAYIYNKVVKGITPSSQMQTIVVLINGSQVATVSTGNVTSADEAIKHFTVVRSNGSWHLLGDPGTTDAADLAEWIPSDGQIPQPGELVRFSDSGKVVKADNAQDIKLAGIVSTKPNMVIGPQTKTSVKLALTGRIPAIVTSLNGVIQTGNSITSSPLSGIGMKPSVTAPVVGKAIETFIPSDQCTEVASLDSINWPADDGTNSAHPCFKVKVQNLSTSVQQESLQKYGLSSSDYIYVGKIMVMAGLSWADSTDLIASLDTINLSSPDDETNILDEDLKTELARLQTVTPIVKAGQKTVEQVGTFSIIASGKIKTSVLTAGTIAVSNFTAGTAHISVLSTKALNVTESLTIQGLPFQDYIAAAINKNNEHIISPLASVKTIETNVIKPLDTDTVTIKGNLAANNASISGTLTASEFNNSGDATIGGTLRTGTIIADNIAGLDDKVGTLAAEIQRQATYTSNLTSSALALSSSSASVSADFGTFYNGLLSLGASTFGDLSVMDQLSIGTSFILSQNAINTLGADLEIQPLRQGGISFLAGLVRISADGRMVVSEDAEFLKGVTVRGGIKTNTISPLPNQDLAITNASNSAVLTISQNGDVASSGSGTFSKLKFSVVGTAIASGNYEAIASGSAGIATLKANTPELTIYNPVVTADSLIYITPANDTTNQVLYLLRQHPEDLSIQGTEGSFTVGISSIINKDIQFNWLVVN